MSKHTHQAFVLLLHCCSCWAFLVHIAAGRRARWSHNGTGRLPLPIGSRRASINARRATPGPPTEAEDGVWNHTQARHHQAPGRVPWRRVHRRRVMSLPTHQIRWANGGARRTSYGAAEETNLRTSRLNGGAIAQQKLLRWGPKTCSHDPPQTNAGAKVDSASSRHPAGTDMQQVRLPRGRRG